VSLAENERRSYACQQWYHIPVIALAMLRPLRVLQLLAFVQVLNRQRPAASSSGHGVRQRCRRHGNRPRCGSVLDAKQNAPGANIKSFGDALWWAA